MLYLHVLYIWFEENIYLQIPAFLYNDKILSRYFPIIFLIIDEKWFYPLTL